MVSIVRVQLVQWKLSVIQSSGVFTIQGLLKNWSKWKDSWDFWNCLLYRGCLLSRDVRSAGFHCIRNISLHSSASIPSALVTWDHSCTTPPHIQIVAIHIEHLHPQFSSPSVFVVWNHQTSPLPTINSVYSQNGTISLLYDWTVYILIILKSLREGPVIDSPTSCQVVLVSRNSYSDSDNRRPRCWSNKYETVSLQNRI